MTAFETGKTHARWSQITDLFGAASELPAGERRPYIIRQTLDDLELREEVLGLLAYDTGPSTGPLTRALGEALEATTRDRRDKLIGKLLGGYKIVSVLGQGGTGTVYLAERADRQYSAQVAIKLVDSAALHGDLRLRFSAERQILASLSHEHIARLLDAGETDEGQPYLVMEYVHGLSVDRYCDRVQLTIPARLELFLKICAAVQYAHQNLVVHRDLKPANVLVTSDGTPKLLDFGIAKLLNVGNDAAALQALTRINDRLLTPEYASPEQILGRTVTTASDVYALGVVLYELLTGARPYVVPGSASQLELERTICVHDPERPSVAIQKAIEFGPRDGESSIQAIAAKRSLTPERVRRRLEGDIDAIVMRALRKEPEHRYGSVEQLIADIRRHLANEAVQARQGNWIYYSQRFARRNVVAVSAGSAFVLFVIGVAVVLTLKNQAIAIERDRANQDRTRAESVSTFMLDVFSSVDPFVNVGKEPTARSLLEQASRRIQSDSELTTDIRGRLLEAMGRSFRRLGFPDRAVPYLQDSLRIQRVAAGRDDARVGSVLAELAIALREAGQFEESDRVFEQALDVLRHSQEPKSEAYAQLLVDLGRLEIFRSNMQQARGHLNTGLELMIEMKGRDHPEVGAILLELATVLLWEDELGTAEKTVRRAAEIYKSSAVLHPDRITADYRLAEILFSQGRINEAAPLFERVLGAQRLLYGSNGTVADTLGSLAQIRIAQNNSKDAETLIQEALTAHKGSGSTPANKIGYLQTMLATIWMGQSKFTEAEILLRDTLDLFAKSLPPDHQYVASAEHYLGECLLENGKLVDAESILTAAMNRWKRTDAPAWRSARSANTLGEALFRQGRMQEAERYLVTSFQALNAHAGADQDTKNKARERIARFYTDRGQRGKLDQLLEKAP